MVNYTLSSGHGKYVSGAIGILNEVTEARKVTNKVADYLKQLGSKVNIYHDDVSRSQRDNINNIVRQHNATNRDIDISTHFNAAASPAAEGVEVLYVNPIMKDEAERLSKAIADAGGFKNRGAKYRDNLGFLNGTSKPALLLEICFVSSKSDADKYRKNFDAICKAVAETLTGKKLSTTQSASKPTTTSPSKPVETIKEENKLYQPSETGRLATSKVLLRFANKEVHGDKAFEMSHRDKFLKGEMTQGEALELLYIAIERGLIIGEGK